MLKHLSTGEILLIVACISGLIWAIPRLWRAVSMNTHLKKEVKHYEKPIDWKNKIKK